MWLARVSPFLIRFIKMAKLADEALGGSCANVLVSLAMLDRHVAPVLRLGDDDEGDLLVNEFSDAGAVTEYISRHRGPALSNTLGRHRHDIVRASF